MKNKKRMIFTFLCSCLLILAFSLTSFAAPSISAKKATLLPGQTLQLSMKNTGGAAVKWSSTKAAVATVNARGLVTAKKAGKAKITAVVSGKKYVCTVTVKTVKLNKTSVSVNAGKTVKLTLKGTTSKNKVVWSSSNTRVATVSGGTVKGVGGGTATITATVYGVRYNCKVTVLQVKLNVPKTSLDAGTSMKCTLSGAKGKVTWSSSNKSVASVASNGTVSGKKAGTVKITAKNNKIKYTATIKVRSLSLNTTSVSMETGSVYTLSIKGGLTSSDKVIWSSSNNNIASVYGGRVTGIGGGTATITANINGKKLTCKFTVKNVMRLSAATLTLQKGSTFQLKLNGTGKAPTWSSSNTGVATVNGSGVVTGVNNGTAYITANVNGNKYTCTTTVKTAATTTTTKPATGQTTTEKTTSGGTVVKGTIADGKVPYYPSAYPALYGSDYARQDIILKRMLIAYNGVNPGTGEMVFNYKAGMKYTNDDYRDWFGGIYRGGYGCAGFCFEMSDAGFIEGKKPNLFAPLSKMYLIDKNGNSDTTLNNVTEIKNKIRVADIIRLDYNTHSVIVIAKDNEGVFVAEANYNKAIKWGRKITYAEILKTGTNIMTRYEANTLSLISIVRLRDGLPILYGALK